MATQLPLSALLEEPSTIRFIEGSDDADLGGIDLSQNPQKTQGHGPFVWLLEDRSEASVTVVGKVIYSAIGDKTGPYFSLPEKRFMPDITTDEMAKAKVGFAIRFINPNLVADVMLPRQLYNHNQAALEYFLTVQEAADEKLTPDKSDGGCNSGPLVNTRPFLKYEEGNPFFVLPVISEPLFPQFKGPRSPGFLRIKRQQGRISLNPAEDMPSVERCSDPHRVLFRDLPDPKSRFTELRKSRAYQNYEMCVPPVFTADGNIVFPWKYEDAIPDGTLVAVRGKMKMYDILSRDRLCISRPYMFVFDRLQVVADGMDGWNSTGPSPSNGSSKKRHFETNAEGDQASKRCGTIFDEEIPDAI